VILQAHLNNRCRVRFCSSGRSGLVDYQDDDGPMGPTLPPAMAKKRASDSLAVALGGGGGGGGGGTRNERDGGGEGGMAGAAMMATSSSAVDGMAIHGSDAKRARVEPSSADADALPDSQQQHAGTRLSAII
jgi:hypothetical protein